MATTLNPNESLKDEQRFKRRKINWNYFLQDNITGSTGLTVWIAFMTIVNLWFSVRQLGAAPGRTIVVLVVWAALILMVVAGEMFGIRSRVSEWLKDNLITSVSNSLVTLFLMLLLTMAFTSFWHYAVTTATWTVAESSIDFRSAQAEAGVEIGASWGVIWGSRKLLLTGLLEPQYNGRVITSAILIGVLWLLTSITNRDRFAENSGIQILKNTTNIGWLISPFALYIFLAGIAYEGPFINFSTLIRWEIVVLAIFGLLYFFNVLQLTPLNIAIWVLAWPLAYVIWRFIGQNGWYPPINVDLWGGLLLTIIFVIFVNLASFPVGILLALGRRADVQGIPWWIIWPVTLILTVGLMYTSTFGNCLGTIPALCENTNLWATSRNNIERVIALWPLIIPLLAYLFQRMYNGNMVQAASVVFIEFVRGVPLITLLFLAIVMAPFFLPVDGSGSFKKVFAVMIGYTIFSAAYMAELIRGGLQAIPRGQYEAADALGMNALQKYRFIILPQALRILIPALAGSVIGTFKSSSLVSLIGLFDFVGIGRAVFTNDQWLGLKTEVYLFLFIAYFLVSSIVSLYSRRIEESTGLGIR